jgi:hypothetical protein
VDGNLRWTAFGPVNARQHRVNIAVTLGDAGTAVDVARGIDLRAITVTERKASLLIDTARAFLQLGPVREGLHRPARRRGSRPRGSRRPPLRPPPPPRPHHHGPAGHPPRRRAVRHPDRYHPVTQDTHGRVLSVIVCGAGPATAIGTFVQLAQERGWTVQVIATPCRPCLLRPGRHRESHRQPRPQPVQQARRAPPPIPDAIIVAPATYNTINKWALGISDTYALGVLAETTALDVPIVVLPFVNTALASREPSASASKPSAPKASASCSAPADSSPTHPAPAETSPTATPGTFP